MRFQPAVLLLFSCVFLPILAAAQTKPAQCDVTCQPDPTSSTYAGTVIARAFPKNGRGRSSVLATAARGDIKSPGEDNPTLPGSQSYGYSVPILGLPGRNGLDLNLMLYYNSHIWTIDLTSGTATFNADRDFPSQGFRLGFGYVEGPITNALGTQSYMLTEPDGSKRELRFSSGTTYVSFDSSYVDWNSSTKVLRRKDGTQWSYQQVGTSTIFRPTQIKDTNGNFISISYRTESYFSNQAINTITDTLGRVITFNYETTKGRLTSITQGAKTWATFSWNTAYTLKYNFTLTVVDSPANNSSQNVLTGCTYPNGTAYTFTYGDWGIVNQFAKVSATGQTRSYVSYNYPSATTALSDHPAFTTRTDFDGVNTGNWTYAVTQTGGQVSSLAITDPAGNATTTYLNTSGWQTGLVSSVAVQTGSTTPRTVTNTWTQDDTTQSYALNPRLLSTMTTLNDSAQTSGVNLAYGANGNVTQVQERDYGLLLVRTTQTDYSTDTNYTSRHILDRPTQVRIYDGSSNLVARTDFGYDGGSPTNVTGAAQHDDTNYGSGLVYRGNVTSTTRYQNASAGTGAIARQFTLTTPGRG